MTALVLFSPRDDSLKSGAFSNENCPASRVSLQPGPHGAIDCCVGLSAPAVRIGINGQNAILPVAMATIESAVVAKHLAEADRMANHAIARSQRRRVGGVWDIDHHCTEGRRVAGVIDCPNDPCPYPCLHARDLLLARRSGRIVGRQETDPWRRCRSSRRSGNYHPHRG